jgi:CRP-like cAMP-binding protein
MTPQQVERAMEHLELANAVTAYFKRLANPPPADIEALVVRGTHRRLEAGEAFCRLGQTRHELAYITTGFVRYYVTLPDGDEATKDFSFSGSFTLSFGSAAVQRPAQVAIAAIVPTELVVWPYQVLLDLYESHPEWQKVGRRVAEFLYVRKEQRELSFLLMDASARYNRMREQFGPQIDLVPQYLLASYLGIRPQSLSRLRKQQASSP